MTTNETSFFRDVNPFETFKTLVLPQLAERRKSRKKLRILCAGAATGQEPYTLAMLLAESGARIPGWTTDILAIDIDTQVLARAEEGLYTQFEVQRGLPVQLLMKYFTQCPGQTWRIKPELRKIVTFRQRNLLNPLTDLGRFDVIFCRNVLIYFQPATMKDVLERLRAQLADDGFLFLSGAETVLNITDKFTPVRDMRGCYAPRAVAPLPRLAMA